MAIVARARTLPLSEADLIVPLGREVLARSFRDRSPCQLGDPLLIWFGRATAMWVRSVERACREMLLGDLTLTAQGANFDNISALASSFYVALFAVCQEVSKPFRSSNPTWLRTPKPGERRAWRTERMLSERFEEILREMASALAAAISPAQDRAAVDIRVADTTHPMGMNDYFDLILTSPPYCTRIDYSAATRTQLAVLWPLVNKPVSQLSREMMGSVRVPIKKLVVSESWGPTCRMFLTKLTSHPSKASPGYYLNTHLDYFSKLDASLQSIAKTLKMGGAAGNCCPRLPL